MSRPAPQLFWPRPGARQHGVGGGALPRHRHRHAFATLVLDGGYVEAGDSGRHHAGPGDVLIHEAFHGHMDAFATRGATLLNLPLPDDFQGVAVGRCEALDAIARLVERDVPGAVALLLEALQPASEASRDWPELLAAALTEDPGLELRAWAQRHGLHPGAVGRGFRQRLGVTPAGFRTGAKARRALRALLGGDAPLAAVAADAGFADQAHMSRVVVQITGETPGGLRRSRLQRERPALAAIRAPR